MSSDIPEPLLALLALLLFPAFWCLVVFAIAKFGGWQRLAEAYRIEQYPARSRRKSGLQSIRLNGSRYNNVVNIDYDEYGLYMQPMILFRIGHPLLYIPWEDITVHPKTDGGLFGGFGLTRELTFSQRPDVSVVFYKRLIEKFERFRDVKMM